MRSPGTPARVDPTTGAEVRLGSRPSIGEYGDLGSTEESLKRVYGFIDANSGD